MSLSTPEEKDARVALMREKQLAKRHPEHPRVAIAADAHESSGTGEVEVLGQVMRGKNGHYLPGCSGNLAGRPRQTLAALCRTVASRRRLVQRLGELAAGVNEFRDADAAIQLRAIELILRYGWGTPREHDPEEGLKPPETLWVKRVVGINDSNV
jgi:hypothetical protein